MGRTEYPSHSREENDSLFPLRDGNEAQPIPSSAKSASDHGARRTTACRDMRCPPQPSTPDFPLRSLARNKDCSEKKKSGRGEEETEGRRGCPSPPRVSPSCAAIFANKGCSSFFFPTLFLGGLFDQVHSRLPKKSKQIDTYKKETKK